jgi:hypothetical protein
MVPVDCPAMATKPKQTLYLIDGHAHAYQQYFAVAGLTSPDGKPTGAVFGVVRLIKKLLEEKKPDFIALIWDPKGKTFRHDLFDAYKAERSPMPPPLKPQIGMITELVEMMGVKVITVPRYEADDVIGTLARSSSTTPRKTCGWAPTGSWRRRGSSRSRCATGWRSRATPPTASPASPASATRPPRRSSRSGATSRTPSPTPTR